MQKGLLVSEFARIVTQFDDFIISLNKIIKENPNDTDLGYEIRKYLRSYE